jgi:hypothetical protein
MKLNLSHEDRDGDDVDSLNYYGEQGWQVIAVQVNGMAYLMRAVEETTSATVDTPPASPRGVLTLDVTSFDRKADETMLRELHILRKLATQEITKLSEFVEVVQYLEPTVEYASVVALLDRLENVGVVTRPQKGKYTAGPNAQQYMLLLIQTLTERKVEIPNGVHKK